MAKTSGCRLGHVLVEQDIRARDLAGGSELPVLSLTKNFGLIPQTQRFGHRVARADVSDYKVVHRGWIVYNPMVIWEGAIHALRSADIGLVSPVYRVWEVSSGEWRFIDYLLRTPPILAEFLRLSSGVVKRRRIIKKESFVDIEIALPSLEEQGQIADRLEVVEATVGGSVGVISSLQELKRSLLLSLIPEPTSSGKTPTGWELRPLREVAKIITGRTPKTSEKANFGGEFQFFTPADIGRAKYLKSAGRTLSAKGIEQTRTVPRGSSLLVCIGASIGRIGFLDIADAATNQQINAVTALDGLDEEFLYYLLLRHTRRVVGLARKTTMPILSKGILGQAEFLIPDSIEEQRHISGAVRAVDQLIDAEDEYRRAALELLNSLILSWIAGRKADQEPSVV